MYSFVNSDIALYSERKKHDINYININHRQKHICIKFTTTNSYKSYSLHESEAFMSTNLTFGIRYKLTSFTLMSSFKLIFYG